MDKDVRKPDENRYINCFLVSGIGEEPIDFDKSVQEGEINRWLIAGVQNYDNPGREAYIEKRRGTEITVADPAVLEPGACVCVCGRESELEVYLPFGDRNVTRSRFCYTATLLSSVAYTDLECAQSGEAEFTLSSCGRAILWIDGEKLAGTDRFVRNTESADSVLVHLERGIHHIRVYLEDIAERDTDFYFRLEIRTGLEVSCVLPLGNRAEAVRRTEQVLSTLRFDRPLFTGGDVTLKADGVCPGMALRFLCGTEENRTAGKLWEKVIFPDGNGRILLGKSEELPAGFLDFDVEARYDGITVSAKNACENWPAALFESEDNDIMVRKAAAIRKLADHGEENINRAVALIETGGDRTLAEKLLLRQIRDINARKDCSDFHLIWLPWLWRKYRNSGIFDEPFWQRVQECILGFRYWMDEPGNDVMWFFSENHALLFHSCQLIAGELFPDEYFPTPALDGKGMQKKAKGMLLDWFERFFSEGFTEWNSSPYFPIDSLGMAHLYLQAEDPEIRSLAKKGLDRLYLFLARYSYRGYLACTAGRTYEKELFGNCSNGTTDLSYVLFGNGNLNQAGKGVLPLCLSDYEPEERARVQSCDPPGMAAIGQITQGLNGFARIFSYRTGSYMLSTAVGFRPGEKGYQEHPMHLVFGPSAQIFVNNPGERRYFGSGRPSYWAGNGILPDAYQYRGFSAVVYLETGAAAPFTHLYLPEEEMDGIRREKERIYVCSGNAYAMIACSGEITEKEEGPFGKREWIRRSPRAVWIFCAGTRDEYPDFDAFVRAKSSCPLLMNEENGSFEWTDERYGRLSASWKQPLLLNGQEVRYDFAGGEGSFEWEKL